MSTDVEKLAAIRAWSRAQVAARATLDAGLVALGVILDAPNTTEPGGQRSRLLIPLYDYPDDASRAGAWAEVARLGDNGVVVVNPSDGDFTVTSASYVKGIAQLDAGGVEWIGYVSTDYGKRPLAAVVDDVETWARLYPSCGGYFLDEQASQWNPIYATIIAACRVARPGGLVISNPGLTGCDARYLTVADVLVMTESAKGVPILPDWAKGARDGKIAILAHGVSTEGQMRAVVAQAKAAGYGLLYVTNRTMGADLWGGLPSYWTALVAAVTAP